MLSALPPSPCSRRSALGAGLAGPEVAGAGGGPGSPQEPPPPPRPEPPGAPRTPPRREPRSPPSPGGASPARRKKRSHSRFAGGPRDGICRDFLGFARIAFPAFGPCQGFLPDFFPSFFTRGKAGSGNFPAVFFPVFPIALEGGNGDFSGISPGFLRDFSTFHSQELELGISRDSIPCFPAPQRVGIGNFPGFHSLFSCPAKSWNWDFPGIPFPVFLPRKELELGISRDSIPCFPAPQRVGIGNFPGFHSLFSSPAESGTEAFSRIPFPGFPAAPRLGWGFIQGFIQDYPTLSQGWSGNFSRIPFPAFSSDLKGWEWSFCWDFIPWFSGSSEAGDGNLSRVFSGI
ncbi:uncharacterized protein [Chamaea fasciata]|uniref:uncharacterized protein n=1 Tax=Chamaea fasciata TaxID=190680 RepID=UPI00336A9697